MLSGVSSTVGLVRQEGSILHDLKTGVGCGQVTVFSDALGALSF